VRGDKMKVVYPTILIPDDGEYIVRVPDLGIATEGRDLADAIYMARDAIGVMGIDYEDCGEKLPQPFSRQVDTSTNDIVTLVDVDLSEYRKKADNRMVKKNCTIPYYLNVEAEKQGVNFSRVLQEALIAKLGMGD
jgi:hypothetical protein